MKDDTRKKKSAHRIGEDAEYSCDMDLPTEGLEMETKAFLLQQLDERGGPRACNRQNKLLNNLCSEFPATLGITGSVRRARTSYLVDRWKRDQDFGTTRANLLASFKLLSLQCPQPKQEDLDEATADQVPEETTSTAVVPVVKKSKATTKPVKVKSSPSIKKKATNKQPDATMSANIGSPIKLILSSANRDEQDKDLEVYFDIDLENEEAHGDYLVTMSTEERVGKMQASAIVVVRPNVAPEDIKSLSATYTKDSISIIGPSKMQGFLEAASGKDGWLTCLKKVEGRFEAAKLHTTLKSMVTKLKKKNRNKTTYISLTDIGIAVSNEYFSPGCPKGKLKLIPLPYKTKGKNGESVTRMLAVWRAYIVGTLGAVEEEDQTAGDEDLLNELLNLNSTT
ncbi:hypothetical protein SEMRO_3283_G346160.1 [Seminavis robusta]|uniref:Uncharacterized protein n=1 Tax=Seminavis robusta TaxID=568900 RepID=A0A9N8HZZ4_9STRA|nr:hypothetical protein SEMRO_3283_G346160.1 [Seminavis robusta]|eukprot:Sro3283_g346160.1 n/a (396) ;mRNA; f:1533-2720